jgi:hypothetical protein
VVFQKKNSATSAPKPVLSLSKGGEKKITTKHAKKNLYGEKIITTKKKGGALSL